MTCRSCGEKTSDILSLGKQQLPTSEEKYPLDVVKCDSCHLVQLKDTVPSEKLYNDSYGYRSGINETIKADLKDIVSSALELVPDAELVVDIGSNDSTLLSYYPEGIAKYGFEPVTKLAKLKHGLNAMIVNDYYSYKPFVDFSGEIKADILTAVSCFYDLPDPNRFVSDLTKHLRQVGIIIIQQNYLLRMLENNAYDNICHEHLEYYSLLSLEPLLERHGLEVFRVEENSINGGSFRTYISHKGSRSVEPSVAEMREEEKKAGLNTKVPYLKFASRAEDLARELGEKLRDIHFRERKTVFAYGASTRGSIIAQKSGIDRTLVKFVVERNSDKIGKEYLGIPIISEEEAGKNPPDYKLILPWFHQSIIEREKGDIPIILPLPEVRVV